MKEFFQLLSLILKERKKVLLSFLFTLFVAFFTYVFVNLVQPIIDNMFRVGESNPSETTNIMNFVFDVFHIGREQLVTFIPLVLVIVVFGKGLFTFLSSFFMRKAGLNIVTDMRNDLFQHLVYQSSQYYDKVSTGELMSRLTSDVDKIQEAVSSNMGDFIREAFILLALITYIFITDWRLAFASLVITPLAVIPLVAFSRQLKKKGRLNQMRMADIYSLLHEAITGNKIIKAFTTEKFEIKRFVRSTSKYLKMSIKLAWIGSLSSPFMEFLGGVVGAFILVVGTTRITQGYISAGDFGSFIMALFMMYTPIKRLSRANTIIQQGRASYERIQEIFKEKAQLDDHFQGSLLPNVKGRVKFENVSFSYNQYYPVLENVNFEVKPSETAALVGLSGGGKTTIINLISRFYEPTSGKITIDGMDIREANLSSLRSQIGLVTQELILFNDTVRNNIAYGGEGVSFEQIKKAAKRAKAHGFIQKLPQGYETCIGEKGSLLSSGQRQRLSIARALVKDPPIFILDEATSALDSESEKMIQMALEDIMKERTAFVIAHRLSTIRNADKILVVEGGQIAEMGSHHQLYRRNGIYRKLYDLQFPEKKEEVS
ncbi:ABC transporter ATP-binding protein [bacterium]|nr:ABC transporter ATP-binding protein [bacterium]